MTIEATIRDLSQQLRSSAESHEVRAAAAATGGAPVYADVGGILVILENGEVVCFDPETNAAEHVSDTRWRTVALVHGARKFPALASLLPVRAGAATTCPACGGSGTVLQNVTCATCFGLGWLQAGEDSQRRE
jgi:hypothetical protein